MPFSDADTGSVSSATTGDMGTSFVNDGSCLGALSVVRRLFRFHNDPKVDLDLDSFSRSLGTIRFSGNEEAFTML